MCSFRRLYHTSRGCCAAAAFAGLCVPKTELGAKASCLRRSRLFAGLQRLRTPPAHSFISRRATNRRWRVCSRCTYIPGSCSHAVVWWAWPSSTCEHECSWDDRIGTVSVDCLSWQLWSVQGERFDFPRRALYPICGLSSRIRYCGNYPCLPLNFPARAPGHRRGRRSARRKRKQRLSE